MQAVIAFNRQLRAGLDEAEIQDLRELLGKLERSVVSEETPAD